LKPHEPIAIVGIGCRFPGAPNPSAFWRVLRDNVETVREYAEKRFDYLDSVYTEDSVRRGLIASRRGGFLPDLDQFDADFFHISRHEAERLDPQQRLLLEVAWEAIEDAGIPVGRLAGTKTGVFVGLWNSDYEDCLYENSRSLDFYASTGGGRYPASGRLAYFLDLRGPNLAVDTACSGSLVAVHLACKSLQNGESEIALAGGVNAILRPEITLIYSASGMLSPEGRCKFGDAAANGYVRSEGCGVLVLKTLSRAVADGDSICALIRGSAVNNDGHSSGLLISPSRDGQQAMLRAAFGDAAIDPQSISYIEAHGTGTLAGDPVEIESIGTVVAGSSRRNACAIGSAKTNIGHTESAAGVAGIIKVALAMREGFLPASLHFNTPNPTIHWDQSIAVHSKNSVWRAEPHTKLIAGVSGFGITGTNAHIVLESADDSACEQAESPNRAELFLLSAHTESVLEKSASNWRDLLASDPAWPASLTDLAFTAATRRTHHDYRCALVANSREELAERLTSWLEKEEQPGVHSGKESSASGERAESGRVAFIFPGQGGQWPGMALGLLRDEPAFRAALEECDAAVFRRTNWHVLDKLQHEPKRNFAHIDVIQPVLFSVEVALAALWRSYGVEPQAVAGHSMGEIAAAVVSGALSLDDGAAIICERSTLMKGASGRGLMALTELNFDAAQELIRKYDGRVSVAAQNSLNSTVLSGDADAIEDALATLEKKEVFCRRISVDVASHSFHVEPFCQKLPQLLAHLQPRKGALPIYSTVTGQVEDGLALSAAYWSKNLRQPVLFHTAIQNLLRDGFDTFIEINAHPVLLQAMEEGIRQSKESSGRSAIAVPSLRRDKEERAELLASLGALHVHGLPINFQKLYPRGTCLRLPTYTWQRERYWLDSTSISNSRSRLSHGHPNLGARIDSSIDPATSLWPVHLPANQNSLDRAALLLEIAVAAAKEISGDSATLHFENLVFHSDSGSESAPAQLAARRAANGSVELKISSRTGSAWSPEFSATLQQGSAPAAHFTAAQKFALDTEDKSALAALFGHLAQSSQAGRAEKSEARIIKIDQVTWRTTKNTPVAAHFAATSQLKFDCQFIDSESHPVADLRGLEFEFIAPSQADNVVYELRWNEIRAQSGASAAANNAAASRTIIFAADTPLTKSLAKELKSAHENFTHVSSAAALTKAVTAAQNTRNILVLSSGSDADSSHALQIARNIVDTVHAATRTSQSAPPKLWLITTGTHQIDTPQINGQSDRASIPAAQGPAWGLGRVIAREHPELACTNVDLPAKPDHADLPALVSLLRSDSKITDELLAIRLGKTYAAHFTRRAASHRPRPLAFSPDATYLLTGGTGGIGLELTRWLINSGAKHIAILSRRSPFAAAEQQLAALRAQSAQGGPEIRWFAADLSGESQLHKALAQISREMPPLRGIFHLAATTDGALISDLTNSPTNDPNNDRLARVMQPKSHGAWLLHRATENLPLDFFVLFSSVAAALSQPGQASYAAANSYMDSLARHRRARGLPALSIQWGPWTGVGLALEEGAIRSVRAYQEQGIDTLPVATALEVLSNLMQSGGTNCLVLPVDWKKFADSYSGETLPSLFRELASPTKNDATAHGDSAAAASANPRQSITKIPAGLARRAALEKHLQQTLAAILKTTAQKIDPLKPMGSLGVDSLTALRFVRRLAVTTDVKLPATAVFNFPTIRLLTAELARRMEISLDASAAAPAEKSNGHSPAASPAPASVTVPENITDLSEEDAIRSLLQDSKGGRK
jgi:myxalamid-type polyketide synthase MxaE and MxaD